MTTCAGCGDPMPARPWSARYCTNACYQRHWKARTGRRAYGGLRQRAPRPIPGADLTPLNIATTARYNACLASGGHTPSARVVERIGYIVPLIVCARCKVPYAPRRDLTAKQPRARVVA